MLDEPAGDVTLASIGSSHNSFGYSGASTIRDVKGKGRAIHSLSTALGDGLNHYDTSYGDEEEDQSMLRALEEDGREYEDLNDARRFEDFETIDWIQDSLFERAKRLRETREASEKAAHLARNQAENSAAIRNGSARGWFTVESHSGRSSRRIWDPRRYISSTPTSFLLSHDQLRHWLSTILHATQSWLVLILVGAAIGVNAAFIDVVTGWLTDIKFGYCRYNWWLNSKFCCWEIDPVGSDDFSGTSEAYCDDWQSWSDLFFGLGYLVYTSYAILFSLAAAYLVRSWAPYAAGSGISEIKCILAGFIMKGFLGPITLLIKTIALVHKYVLRLQKKQPANLAVYLQPLVIASGLSVGKEGPTVHIASAIGSVVGGWFQRFSRSQGSFTCTSVYSHRCLNLPLQSRCAKSSPPHQQPV